MSSKRGVEFLKAVADYCIKHGGHDPLKNAFRITGGGDGRCIGEFTVAKEHLNAYGKLHGGCAATIIDNVTTYALMSADSHPGVTIDMNIRYLKSAKEGDEIIVDANTVKAGKRIAFIDCVLKHKADESIIIKGGQTKFIN